MARAASQTTRSRPSASRQLSESARDAREQGASVRPALARRGRRAGRGRRRLRLPVSARRPRAPVREGLDCDRLESPSSRSSASRPLISSRCCSPARLAPTSRPASAVRIGLVPRADDGADRIGGQRRGRGCEDGASCPSRSATRRRPCSTRSPTSSCQTATISTTVSWSSSPSRCSSRTTADRGVALARSVVPAQITRRLAHDLDQAGFGMEDLAG